MATPTRWALIAGINRYERTEVTPLRYAVRDARALGKALIQYCDFPRDQVIVLTSVDAEPGRKPTKGNLVHQLGVLRNQVQPEDTVLFFFAGHGCEFSGRSYLMTTEASLLDEETVRDTCLALKRVHHLLARLKARRQIVLLDACRNHPRAGRGQEDNVLTEEFAEEAKFHPRDPGFDLLATVYACKTGQRSFEWEQKKRGFFTHFLLKGLQGEACDDEGQVTLSTLAPFLARAVPKATREHLNLLQEPWIEIQGSAAHEFCLATHLDRVSRTTLPDPELLKRAEAIRRQLQGLDLGSMTEEMEAALDEFVRNRPIHQRKALRSTRVVLESILLQMFVQEFGQRPSEKLMVGHLIEKLRTRKEVIPGDIFVDLTTVQNWGNQASHAAFEGTATRLEPEHVESALEALVRVLKWHFGRTPATSPRRRKDTPAPAPALPSRVGVCPLCGDPHYDQPENPTWFECRSCRRSPLCRSHRDPVRLACPDCATAEAAAEAPSRPPAKPNTIEAPAPAPPASPAESTSPDPAQKTSIPTVDLTGRRILRSDLERIPEDVAKKYQFVVFELAQDGREASIAALDPADPRLRAILKFIEERNGLRVRLYCTDPASFAAAMAQYGAPDQMQGQAVQQPPAQPATPSEAAPGPEREQDPDLSGLSTSAGEESDGTVEQEAAPPPTIASFLKEWATAKYEAAEAELRELDSLHDEEVRLERLLDLQTRFEGTKPPADAVMDLAPVDRTRFRDWASRIRREVAEALERIQRVRQEAAPPRTAAEDQKSNLQLTPDGEIFLTPELLQKSGKDFAVLLQEAVEFVREGGTIRLGPGVFSLDAEIMITKTLSLVGSGLDETELQSRGECGLLEFDGNGSWEVRDLTFTSGSSYPHLVRVASGTGNFKRCRFKGPANTTDGSEIRKARCGLSITQGRVTACESIGHDAGFVLWGAVWVVGCSGHSNRVGIWIPEGAPVVRESHCARNAQDGIQVGGSAAPDLVQNHCKGNGASGIHICGSSHAQLLENRCEDNQRCGIVATAESTPLLEGNVCQNNSGAGLAFLQQAGGSAFHNECDSNKAQGILVADSASPTLVKNLCRQNSLSGIRCCGSAAVEATENECRENWGWSLEIVDEVRGLIQRNVFANNEFGVLVAGTASPTFRRNRFEGTQKNSEFRDKCRPRFETGPRLRTVRDLVDARRYRGPGPRTGVQDGPGISVHYSPDGSAILVATERLSLYLFEASSLRVLCMKASERPIQEACFSPDGQQLVVAAEDGSITWRDVATPERSRGQWSAPSGFFRGTAARGLAFSQDGSSLAAVFDDGVRVWKPGRDTSAEPLVTLAQRGLKCVAISPEGDRIAAAGNDRNIRIWSGRGENWGAPVILKGHTSGIEALAFSPESIFMASASKDGTVRLWNLADGVQVHRYSVPGAHFSSVAFSPDGSCLAAGDTIKVDLLPEERKRGPKRPEPACNFVFVWSALTGQELARFSGHTKHVRSICFSPDGRWLASTGDDATVRLWPLAPGA